MDVLKIAAVGITGVLIAIQFKNQKPEYSMYISIASAVLIFFYAAGKLSFIIETIEKLQNYIHINSAYIRTLVKMLGITYVAEFSAGICKDAGYQAIAGQIEIFGKLAILAVSMPILSSLLELIDGFLK